MKENEKGKKISKKIVSIVVLLAVLITTLVVVSMNKNTINLAKVGNVERKAEGSIYNGFEIGLVMYDSTVDSGKTQFTEHTWNATSDETRLLTLQINFKNSDANLTYYPGELRITVDNLGKIIPIDANSTTFMEATSIAADRVEVENKTYDWSYEFDEEKQKYIFINNNLLEADANFEGTIQLAYEIRSINVPINSYVELDANLNEIVYSTNKLKFTFIGKNKAGTGNLSTGKLKAYDGLGSNAEDYIWIKHTYNYSANSSGSHGFVTDNYVELVVDPDCKVYNTNLVQLSREENGNVRLPVSVSTYSTYTGVNSSFYVGYPKAKYDESNVTCRVEWYGKYKESYYVSNPENEIVLIYGKDGEYYSGDFKITFEGDLYSVSKAGNTGRRSYNRIVNSNYGETIEYYFKTTTLYTGTTYDAEIGDDIVYITSFDGEYRLLTDDEYYFKSVYIRPYYIKNANGLRWDDDKYTVKLFVRYANTTEYVQYKEDLVLKPSNSSSKTITFAEDEKVVGWYFRFCDMEDSIVITDSNAIRTTLHIQTDNDISISGDFYNFNYLKVYTTNEDGERILQNPATLDNYENDLSVEKVANYDLDTYGSYIHRGYLSMSYFEDDYMNMSWTYSLSSTKKTSDYFYRTFTATPVSSNSQSTCSGTKEFNGYRMFVIIPAGIEVDTTAEEIINSLSVSKYSFTKPDGTTYTQAEYLEFIKERLTIEIIPNYKETEQTCISIKLDYSDAPLNMYYINSNLENYKIPLRIPLESYFLYGSNYSIRTVITFLNEEELYLPYNKNTDTQDYDMDGLTTDFNIINSSMSLSTVVTVSSFQEVKKMVKTENTDDEYVSGIVMVKNGEEYTYKLRIRTGINDITNLVLYDNVEGLVTDSWRGEFQGVDTSYATKQGFDVKVWYSTLSDAGTLEDNPDNWLEYTDDVDKTTVKNLAFDYGKSTIQSSGLTYVLIKMKVPDTLDTVQVVRNRCSTRWNALSTTGELIDNIVGINSNIVTLAFPKSVDDIAIEKVWEDNENELGVRPDNITVNINQNGTQIETQTLNEANNWKYILEDTRLFDDNEVLYDYSVDEINVNLYSSEVEETYLNPEVGSTFTITNTMLQSVYVNVTGQKTWTDDDNLRQRRPDAVEFILYRDGVEVARTTTSERQGWVYQFEQQQLWKNNSEQYTYTVEEAPVQYYNSVLDPVEEIDTNALQIIFSERCLTESVSWDWVEIYYELDGKIYKVGRWGGSDLANLVVTIPTKDFYLYWRTDSSQHNYYGFSIDLIQDVLTDTFSSASISSLPSYTQQEISGYNYPESEHVYEDNLNEVWHYSYIPDRPEVSKVDAANEYIKIPTSVLVHHYKEGTTESISEDVVIEGIVWDPYETTVATDIPVYYELVETPLNATGEFTEEQIEVIYYYKYKEYDYNIEYYYDGVLNEEETETITATYADVIDAYENKVIDGYKLEKEENLPLTVSEVSENNIIKVYYIKDDFDYTIEYYYDGELNEEETVQGTATFQDVIDTFEDKNITGYKLEKEENLPLTITSNEANNVIKVYYVKDNFDYTVEYYYDGELDEEKTEVISATYQDVIDIYDDKNITGYKLEREENFPLTVSEVEANNVIKVYYVKDNFDYIVEYYFNGNIDSTKTETIEATYMDVINTYTSKIETGYMLEKEENLPLTVSEMEENNVIRVYYITDPSQIKELTYTVEYYKNGEKVSADTQMEKIVVQYLEPDTMIVNKDLINVVDKYYGYKIDTENTTVPDVVTTGDIIKVYYVTDEDVKKTIFYTIEYYKDNILADRDIEQEEVQVLEDDILSVNISNINVIDKYVGYIFDKVEPEIIPTEISTGGVIKVYYIRDTFGYTIEYYYDGVKDDSLTDNKTALYNDEITTYTNNLKVGYKLDKVESIPMNVTENPSNNIIKVYYVTDESQTKELSYTVEYYKDGTKVDSDTELEKETVQVLKPDSLTVNKTKINVVDKYIGYRLDKIEPTSIPDTVNSGDVIKVYYVRDNFNYRVEYYFNDVIDSSKTEVIVATYQDVISTYTDKVEVGYKLDRVETIPFTVTENEEINVIKVYYVTDESQTKELSYTVEYYKDGVLAESEVEKTTVQVLEANTMTVNEEKINIVDKFEGYYFEKTEPEIIPTTVNSGDIVKVYYNKRADLSYTVRYLEQNTNIALASEKVVSNQVFETQVTEQAIEIAGYNKVDPTERTITIQVDENIIDFYYTKRTDLSYRVEYYFNNVIDDSLTENINNQTYETVINTYTDKVKVGYKFDKVETIPMTVGLNENVIKVYYITDDSQTKELTYNVEYYKNGVKEEIDTQTEKIIVQVLEPNTMTVLKDKINITNKYYGYKIDVDNTIIPDSVTSGDVIKVYYVTDESVTKTIFYTVEYYKDNVFADRYIKQEVVQVLEADTLNVDKSLININDKYVGYKFEKTEPTGIPDTVNSGDVIKVYYVRDTFGYSVEYYFDGIKDESLTDNFTALYNDEITTYTDKVKVGYKLHVVETIPMAVTENAANNVIRVYYVIDETQTKALSYTVEYYKNGVKVDSDTQTESKTVQILDNNILNVDKSKINLVDKYYGYKLDAENTVIPDDVTTGSVINVYYVVDDGNTKNLSYTVEYYKDNVLVQTDTDIVTETVQVLEPNTLNVDKTTINITDKYVGYKFDKVDPEVIPDTVFDGSVIKVYYVRDTFSYSMEYYFDGVKDDALTQSYIALYNEKINNHIDKVKVGYTLERVDPLPLTVTEDTANNVMRIYYITDELQTKELSYTVEYYKDNVLVSSDTEVEKTTVQVLQPDIMTVDKLKINIIDKYVGYKIEKLEPNTIPDTVNNGDVIKIYYVRDNFDYTVEYYFDGIKDESLTDTFTATYGDKIETYTNKVKDGYILNREVNLPLTITENVSENLIQVYYVIDNAQTKVLSYTVEYYRNGEKVSQDTQIEKITVQLLQPNTMTVNKTNINLVDKYYGYKLDAENTVVPDTVNSGDVIKIYYITDEAVTKTLFYTVEYYKDNVLADRDVEQQVVQVLEPDILIVNKTNINIVNKYVGYKFDRVDPEIIPDTIANGGLIKVYYSRDTFGYSMEYYFDGIKDESLTDNYTALYNEKINDHIDKVKVGYTLDKVEPLPLIVTENTTDNIMKIYYIIDDLQTKELSYTVEYYKDNVLVSADTEVEKETVQILEDDILDVDKSKINLVDKYFGYKLDSKTVVPDTITTGETIKVYYITDELETKDLSYTVEYYKDGIKVDSDTEVESETVQVLEDDRLAVRVANINMTDKYVGYKFEKVEPGTIPTEVDTGTVIKVYYVKDTFSYTVEYYFNNVKDDSLTENKIALFEEVIDTYTDKVKAGYKLDRVETLPMSITENAANNVIRVYYITDETQTKELSYTVEYYKDNVLV